MHILWVLNTSGPTRFGALRRQIDGISSRLLTERLRDLEEKGFIFRDYKPTIPPAVTYGLTKRMQEIGWPSTSSTNLLKNGSRKTPNESDATRRVCDI
jgi:DNA-binding HxlR family transcriptional regulator